MTTALPEAMEAGQFENGNRSQPEGLLSPETVDLIAGVGNHEAKALLMIYLGECPPRLIRRDMGAGFRDFIGDETDWKPRLTQPFNYCEASFEPVGQVVESRVEQDGKWSTAYSISDRGQELGVPLAGLLLRWSLDNPDISLQQVFGSTRSSGSIRAPQSRAEILAELITAPEQGLSLASIAGNDHRTVDIGEYTKKIENFRNAAEALENHGFVTVDRVIDANTRQFLIEDPAKPHVGGPRRSPVTSAVYDFVQNSFSEGKKLFDYEECLEHVIGSLEDGDKPIDQADVRKQLSLLLASRLTSMPGVKRLGSFNNGGHTKITLNEEYRESLGELVAIILSVEDRDEPRLEDGRKAAREISQDTGLKGNLMTKAKKFSPDMQKQPTEQTAHEIEGILAGAEEPIDTETIRELYKDQYGRTLTRGGVQLILRGLAKDGERGLIVEQKRSKSSVKTQRNHYSIKKKGE